MKSAWATTVAAAAAVALAAGTTTPASAQGAADAAVGSRLTPKSTHRVTLITGDRVVVDGKGRPVAFEAAEGREHIPVQTERRDGHTLVIPRDARTLIADGRVDVRLFDVTELSKARLRKAQGEDLKLIVGYKGAAAPAAKAEVRSAGGTEVSRTFTSLNADALSTPKTDAADVWGALTSAKRGSDALTTTAGVDRVWLDGVRKASLDTSVGQIGADKAWAAGFDGKGVKIAVLDTGVDADHPDLVGQVVAEKNFSVSKDAEDRFGHGTHVASIAAGTGAKSKGRYKGVAPGAKLLNGKVLSDDGYGEDSEIVAGMEWAVAQGADVVNLSLGGTDGPTVDPLEAAVDELSAEKGVLFAVAAGNEGEFGPGTVGSPGSADAALTVGAVDDKDKLASFSSRGPRVGDGGIKPDVTAPGVDITAAAAPGSVIDREVGQKPAGYLTISGTSMATPHVAGAAAILKQQHPNWTYAELKGALTASAKGGKYNPFQQGSGRVQVDKAIKQTVIADPVSVGFGVQEWPHADDKKATEQVTYRNLGTKDVTLNLAVAATDPKGKAAPKGFFTLKPTEVTVPAGGKASVGLTVNTVLGGTVDGTYSAYVTATGGGQSVRTAAAVEREAESYTLTVKYIGRDGKPAPLNDSSLVGVSGAAEGEDHYVTDPSGTAKVRVPKGKYILNSNIITDEKDPAKGIYWIARPSLTISKATTLTVDARTAKPVSITVPDQGAKSVLAAPGYDVEVGDSGYGFGWALDRYEGFHTAHAGPAIPGGKLYQQWQSVLTKGDDTEYDMVFGKKVEKLATGYARTVKAADLATVKVGLGAPAPGKTGALTAWGYLPDSSGGWAVGIDQKLPGTRTLHLSTADKVEWGLDFNQNGPVDEDGWPTSEASYTLGTPQIFKAGKSYKKTFNTGVFGPRLSSQYGIFREGNKIYGYLPVFADGQTHAGGSLYTSVATTLYRDGKKVKTTDDPLVGEEEFTVPSGDAPYKLITSIKRSAKLAAVSTRIDASWTFRSKRVTGGDPKLLPASAVRFSPKLALDSTAAAGATQSVPVKVLGAAAKKGNLKSLHVYASYDGGQNWTKLTVKGGKVSVKNPAAGKGIAFHAKITDKQGNKSTLSIYNAYRGK